MLQILHQEWWSRGKHADGKQKRTSACRGWFEDITWPACADVTRTDGDHYRAEGIRGLVPDQFGSDSGVTDVSVSAIWVLVVDLACSSSALQWRSTELFGGYQLTSKLNTLRSSASCHNQWTLSCFPNIGRPSIVPSPCVTPCLLGFICVVQLPIELPLPVPLLSTQRGRCSDWCSMLPPNAPGRSVLPVCMCCLQWTNIVQYPSVRLTWTHAQLAPISPPDQVYII